MRVCDGYRCGCSGVSMCDGYRSECIRWGEGV